MELLFSPNLISGSVKTQADLDAALSKYPDISGNYIQTALYWENLRKWYESHWPKVYKFLDRDFVQRFKMKQEHNARAWEFHVAAVFTEKGLKLEEKTWEYGPDFCIKTSSGKRIWVEAISCDPIPKRDMISGVAITVNIEDDYPPRAVRITGAINTKFKKYKEEYLTNSRSQITKNDCLIIAVNGEGIEDSSISKMLFKWAVFGQGPDIYIKPAGQDELRGPFYKPIPTIIKANGIEIPTRFLEMDETKIISAVIYCGHNVLHDWLNGYDIGDNFFFAYHTNPKNPIPENTFGFGTGIHKNPHSQQIMDLEQK